MAKSPNTDNYVLGKGVVYFNESVAGVYQGERDLGNAPAFSFSVAVEKLEHFSSRGGLRAKDKEVISQITPSLAFTLDEINAENIGLLSLGTVDEAASEAAMGYTEADLVSIHGKRTALAHRLVGTNNLIKLALAAGGTQLPAVGEILTGATSAATLAVVFVEGDATATTGNIWAYPLTGTAKVDGEDYAGNGTPAADITTSAATNHGSPLLVCDDANAATVYDPWDPATSTGDYWFNTNLKDNKAGRFLVMAEGTMPNDVTGVTGVYVAYYVVGGTFTKVKAFTKSSIEGFLRFISDNPVGTQQELKVWKVSLAPTGDTAYIGDDWATLGFTGEILKDETGHPDSPYMDINFL